MSTPQEAQFTTATGGRGPADVSTLLVELGRAMRGQQFYPEGHPAREELLDRSWSAWKTDLEHHGPLELEVRRGAFWQGGAAVGRGRLDELAREFVVRAVRRLRFDAELDAPSFRCLVEVLTLESEVLEERGGIERVLYGEPRRGIQVNEVDYAALESGREEPVAEAAEETAVEAAEQVRREVEPEQPEAVPDARAQLDAVLRELEECDDALRYADLVARSVELGAELAATGLADQGYRTLRTLSEHAGDEDKRPEAQRELARRAVRELATGVVLDDLVQRACSPGAEASLPATQLLLALGPDVVPDLFARLDASESTEQRERLGGILVAMGEAAGPELSRAMEGDDPQRARTAVRLAGETQNPAAVPRLRRVLEGAEPALRREAAKALVRIGNPEALEGLCHALASPLPEVAALAAFGLGSSGSRAALRPLVESADRALRAGRHELAREAVRALGRLGRPEAVPVLEKLLARRSLFRRRRLREVQLVATEALARLPGEQARDALARAARARDAHLRRAAARALERQAPQAGAA